MRSRFTATTLLCLLVTSIPVSAVTMTQTAGPTSPVGNITSTIDFNTSTATDPAGHATYTNAQFNQGSSVNGTPWLSSNGQVITIAFNLPVDYFGLQWGTPDPGNTLQIFNGATSLFTQTGNGITNNYVNFFADAGQQFTSVQLSMNGCCFETDNHSYRLAAVAGVPEPSLFIPGLLLAAGSLTWRRYSSR